MDVGRIAWVSVRGFYFKNFKGLLKFPFFKMRFKQTFCFFFNFSYPRYDFLSWDFWFSFPQTPGGRVLGKRVWGNPFRPVGDLGGFPV